MTLYNTAANMMAELGIELLLNVVLLQNIQCGFCIHALKGRKITCVTHAPMKV